MNMQRVGSYFLLLLTLACPALCRVGVSGGAATEAARHVEQSDPFPCCPDEQNVPPPNEPSGDTACLCSPFVLYQPKLAGETDFLALSAAVLDAWCDTTADVTPQPTSAVAAGHARAPGPACTVGHGLPLLI
jgi:hypothetical protein